MRGGLGLLAGLALAGLVAAAPAAAEARRVEVAGAVAAADDAPSEAVLRRAALGAAVDRAVEGVARELLAGGAADADLAAVLGDDLRDYTTRFGLRRVRGLETTDPETAARLGADRVFVVEAEVWVDEDRLRRRLEDAGLLSPRGLVAGPRREVRVVLEPLHGYAAYAFVRDALGASPRRLEPGRAELAVETDGSADALLARLRRRAPPGTEIVADGVEGDRLRLDVRLDPAAAGGPGEGPPAD